MNMRGIQWNNLMSKFVKKTQHARYGVRVIYTSKGMSKKCWVRDIRRCALSTGKYGIIISYMLKRVKETICLTFYLYIV
jgi:hypothetical protein